MKTPPTPSLAIYSTDLAPQLKNDATPEALRALGFIGEQLDERQYLTGDQFLHHICFVGCAPNIALEPAQGEHYLRVDIPHLDAPSLFTAPRTQPVHCPQCKAIIEDWAKQLNPAGVKDVVCPHCDSTSPARTLNFRKKACFTQQLIRISPVFESEAIPNKTLLASLTKLLGLRFQFAYL